MSRQPTSTEPSLQEVADEEAISGTGEGDENMEDAEEQEDGYSECFFQSYRSVMLSCLSNDVLISFSDI